MLVIARGRENAVHHQEDHCDDEAVSQTPETLTTRFGNPAFYLPYDDY
jgi:hypothetical protein